jgi:hypothetical protein
VSERVPGDEEDLAWLEARELGTARPPLAEPRIAAYEALMAGLARLPDQPAPEGWQVDVLAALPEQPAEQPATVNPLPRPARRWRLRRWAPALAAAAVVAAAGVSWRWWSRSAGPSMRSMEVALGPPHVQVLPGQRSRVAGTDAALGDTLQIRAQTWRGGQLRIYRDERVVVLQCPGQPGCSERNGALLAELLLAAPGTYRAVLLRPAPASPPSGSLDDDLAACECESTISVPVTVR